MADTVKIGRDPDYYPLLEGLKLVYHHTSTEFDGIETVEIVFTRVETLNDAASAVAVMTRARLGQASRLAFNVKKTAKQLHSEGGALGLARLEFPIPPVPGKAWIEAPDRHEVASLDAAIEVPAGKFRRCLRVNTYLAGGDGGSAIRYYAPGVGYVYEEYSDEAWGSRVVLVSFEPPGPKS